MQTLLKPFFLFSLLSGTFQISTSLFALEVGDFAPCVELAGVNEKGNPVEGCIREPINPQHQYTVVDFFSVVCSTCKLNVPIVSQLTKDIADVATVRYVSIDRDGSRVKAFIKEHQVQMNLPVAFDTKWNAKNAYEVFGTPTIFVLKKVEGGYKIVHKHIGFLTPRDVADIRNLVSQP